MLEIINIKKQCVWIRYCRLWSLIFNGYLFMSEKLLGVHSNFNLITENKITIYLFLACSSEWSSSGWRYCNLHASSISSYYWGTRCLLGKVQIMVLFRGLLFNSQGIFYFTDLNCRLLYLKMLTARVWCKAS